MRKSLNHVSFETDHHGQQYEYFVRNNEVEYAATDRPVQPDGYRTGHYLTTIGHVKAGGWYGLMPEAVAVKLGADPF